MRSSCPSPLQITPMRERSDDSRFRRLNPPDVDRITRPFTWTLYNPFGMSLQLSSILYRYSVNHVWKTFNVPTSLYILYYFIRHHAPIRLCTRSYFSPIDLPIYTIYLSNRDNLCGRVVYYYITLWWNNNLIHFSIRHTTTNVCSFC